MPGKKRTYLNYSIFRDERSPFWIAQIRTETGRIKFSTKVIANEQNKELATEIARARYYKEIKQEQLGIKERQRITLSQAFGTYLEYEGHKLSKGAYEAVNSTISALKTEFNLNILFDTITTASLATWLKNLQKTNRETGLRDDGPVSNGAKNRYIAVFRRVCNFLSDFNIEVPEIKYKALKLKEPHSKENDINLKQLDKLLKKLPEHQRAIVLFAVLTGLRKSNILSLTWEQVNLFNKTISVKVKGGKNRTVPISKATEKLLKELNPSTGPVFLYKGKPIKNTKSAFNKAKERAGLGFLTFHGLRHTFGCMLIEHADLKDVQDAMHHNDPRTTLRYARRKQERIREAMNNNANFVEIGLTMRGGK